MTRIAIIGAGSWGTAMAALLGGKGLDVALWARDPEAATTITTEHRNPRHLTDVVLPRRVTATSDVRAAIDGAEVVVIATPSHAVRAAAEAMRGALASSTPVVSLAKGLERDTLMRMTEVLSEVLGNRERVAALSGPNHAEEVSVGIPSASVVAAYDEALGLRLREVFSAATFRVYTNPDVVGVEIAAATKNVIAVAAGMSDGLGFGDNTKATLMTRGLAEMARLGTRLGANPLTYMGLAGVGDLIATCTSRHSRNRALGEHIARGGTVESFAEQTHMVAEGAFACVAVDELGKRYGVEMPITHQVRAILYEGASVSSAADALMGREAKDELHGMGLVDD
ncbi:MAG: NAD(P)H-dependent glycerol-3-phosphate dehydrogenase [Anaerosomatales bacterium]|nr:NAD(P)H-dependent glycerol-3-phosphate dehydrogenase [Anaerosomatales bacterium]